MKELLVICVNYNSYKELYAYLKSICIAKSECSEIITTVYIADNSTSYQEVDIASYNDIIIQQIHFENLGYMGAAQAVINNLSCISKYDFLIISNVDILMDRDFLVQLNSMQLKEDIGWIVPSIKSMLINRDKNPSVFYRYPKWKLIALKYTYNRFVLPIYEKYYYNTKQQGISYEEQDIYAGHGSFFLFTKSFIKVYPKLDYPVFLYGEELYFAELNKVAGLRVRYIPSLIIHDFEHVSTSLIRRQTYYDYNKQAINYILKRFY